MQPLIPEPAVNPGYVNPIDYGLYSGFVDSAIFCSHPAFFQSSFIAPMASESYNCPASLLPFEFENQNPKYYNPVCRDWFKDSEKAQDKGIISDPYLMAQGDNLYGITPCMPILE